MIGERTAVLLAAAGAAWEVPAITALGAPGSRAVLLRRCVDLPDLLATASTGQARVAVVAEGLPGLDADSVDRLRRDGVAVVVVATADTPVTGLPGTFGTLGAGEVERLATVVGAAAAAAARPEDPAGPGIALPDGHPRDEGEPFVGGTAEGRLVAVWGPAGSPGRTTVAVNLAAELARRGHDTLLVDADPYGAAVAQHLGVLDEASGLLGAVRLANAGRLDPERLAATARTAAPGLRVLTGLPRPDRWVEVRAAAFSTLLDTSRQLARFVVLDLGFDLVQDSAAYGLAGPQRNHMTVAALDAADEVVVVGAADPVGLARLARGLVELPAVAPTTATHVVVNRVRPSLGWGEREVRAMVAGFISPAGTHLLPDHQASVDRALVAGRPLLEVGESPLVRGLGGLADALDGSAGRAVPGAGRLRRRRAGRDR